MTVSVSAIGAILPSFLLLWYFYKHDLHPEPRGVLIKTFLFGVLIVVPTVVVTLPVMLLMPTPESPLLHALLVAFFCAAIPEEFFKFVVITRYSMRDPAFNEPMDGVVYGVVASLGFATLENVIYVVGGGWPVALTRAFSAVPMHAFLGAILGYYVGQAWCIAQSRASGWQGLWLAILLHGLYDFGLLTVLQIGLRGTSDVDEPSMGQIGLALAMLLLALATFITTGVWARRLVHKLRRQQLEAVTLATATK